MSNLESVARRKILWASLLATGVGLVVVAAVLGASSLMSATSGAAHAGPLVASPNLHSSSSGVRVHSHSFGISTGPTTTTGGLGAAAGSDILVFVGFSNAIIGGGSISSVTDSSGNSYKQIVTTGFENNHTESLFLAKDVPSASGLAVSVTFAGGATTQGGTVAAIDVVGLSNSPVDVKAKHSGVGSIASVALQTTSTSDLFLFGVSGQGKIANVTAGDHERLLNTSGGTVGPFTNGEGFGTFSTSGETGVFALAAGLAHAAAWNGIVVGLRPAAAA
jgi:hypothetical protein